MLLPFDQCFVEILTHLLLPDQAAGVGAQRNCGDVSPQQFVHRGPGHHGPTGAGYPYHYRVRLSAGHSATARTVNRNSTMEITLLYWKRGELSLDRSSGLSSPFSKANRLTAMAQPMK